jgi:predicted RNase H-like nuclease (RuvC/YqgF family)
LKTELSLIDFQNSRESSEHIDTAHEEIEKLRKQLKSVQEDNKNLVAGIAILSDKLAQSKNKANRLETKLETVKKKLTRTKTYQQNRIAKLAQENSS